MLGMLALGLVAGAAIGGYAVSKRAQIKRLAMRAGGTADEPAIGEVEAVQSPTDAARRSNHGRKAPSEV
jgi:hypothetical protein